MKCSLGISDFPEEISSISHPIVFLYFFTLIAEEGFLISPCFSLELCTQMNISFIFSFSFCFFSQLFVRPCQTTILPFLHFVFLGMILITASCTMSQILFIVLQALSLSDLIPWIYSSSPVYNHKGFDLGHTWMAYLFFSTLFNLSLNFAIHISLSEPQSALGFVFAHCIEVLHFRLQRI